MLMLPTSPFRLFSLTLSLSLSLSPFPFLPSLYFLFYSLYNLIYFFISLSLFL